MPEYGGGKEKGAFMAVGPLYGGPMLSCISLPKVFGRTAPTALWVISEYWEEN